MASRFPADDPWRAGTKIKAIKKLQKQIDKTLKDSLAGLRRVDKKGRPDNFTFRIYTREEFENKIKSGDQIID
ncbi:hypothetical protein J25TS5_37300 [Paenibacillus faecis]|nr:hypothetical protein J25TS5_37300 [Paenibacillus faecis]